MRLFLGAINFVLAGINIAFTVQGGFKWYSIPVILFSLGVGTWILSQRDYD